MPSICIGCGDEIDTHPAVRQAIDEERLYRHPCGRELYRPSDHIAEAEHTAEVEGYGPR